MFSAVHTPVAPLSTFVSKLWSLSDAPSHARERIVPSGTFELVINLDEDEFRIYDSTGSEHVRRFSGAMLSGAYRRFFVIDTREHASVMGVHFRPGGALPFLGHPPGLFPDSHIDLETLWGTHAGELRERLCSAPTLALRFQILEAALLGRLRRPLKRHGAVRVALSALDRGTRVGDIVQQVGLSHRRFNELFTAEVGMTPKLYGRVQRFQRASRLARRRSSAGWSELAAECGYFDQSHLIRDFIDFSGFSPAEFLRHSIPQVKEGHVALLGADGSSSSNTGAPSQP
ncbi:MAG TPA: AraC family transcriptional regulator [Polyangiaceae bacterium]